MLLGKRPRPPMRRTTSMRALPAEELVTMQESPAAALGSAAPGGNFKVEQPKQRSITTVNNKSGTAATALANSDGGNSKGNGREFALSPRGGSSSSSRPRRNSADLLLMDATHFLRSCTLCKRPIGPGRDIYMYRGDTAYCSVECRQQQVNLDEKKAKCSVMSLKKESPPAASETSAKGETATAA